MTTADPRFEYATGTRLRAWSRVWRYLLVVLMAVFGHAMMYGSLILVAEVGALTVNAEDVPEMAIVLLMAGVDALVCVLAIALLPLRRRAPATIATIIAALSSISSATGSGPAMLAAVSNATHRRWGPIVINGVVFVAALMTFYVLFPSQAFGPTPDILMFVGAIITFLVPAGFGLFIGARRALLASLHERAVKAERERALEVHAAQAGERTRIAREMHDVLAHRISLVAMHAGGLAYRDDLSREETASAARLVQDNARRALAELRQVLGVLRPDGSGVEPPQPTLEVLPALIAEVREAGVDVDLEGSLAEGDPPDLVSRTAFRLVQEALTNARKHAPGAPVRVRVDGRPGGLLAIEVTNGSAAPGVRPVVADGSGLGLAGLAERVDLAGGTIDYGPDGKHGFAVRAWLPWEGETDD
ncbi:hypothetical protein GCM10010915_03520 [Microbacterium faecale]|uniref:histidine kinase n=1 Tax=Microbacterium faecale TaxID=1804630 RepID=A0A916Y2Q8_9MICO|nr:histidine kinase [Microbacterium faecale]GGD26790.1 hypothetical protein GCM10010915_03520 [Microbacterium faecale]